MLKRVNYVVDDTASFIVDADDDDYAINKAIDLHEEIRDYYEEEELEEVKNPDNYEVVDIDGIDMMYELKNVIEYAMENSVDITLKDNVLALQCY